MLGGRYGGGRKGRGDCVGELVGWSHGDCYCTREMGESYTFQDLRADLKHNASELREGGWHDSQIPTFVERG